MEVGRKDERDEGKVDEYDVKKAEESNAETLI